MRTTGSAESCADALIPVLEENCPRSDVMRASREVTVVRRLCELLAPSVLVFPGKIRIATIHLLRCAEEWDIMVRPGKTAGKGSGHGR